MRDPDTYSLLECWLTWLCSGLVQATTGSVSSWVQWFCHIQKTLFYPSPLWSLTILPPSLPLSVQNLSLVSYSSTNYPILANFWAAFYFHPNSSPPYGFSWTYSCGLLPSIYGFHSPLSMQHSEGSFKKIDEFCSCLTSAIAHYWFPTGLYSTFLWARRQYFTWILPIFYIYFWQFFAFSSGSSLTCLLIVCQPCQTIISSLSHALVGTFPLTILFNYYFLERSFWILYIKIASQHFTFISNIGLTAVWIIIYHLLNRYLSVSLYHDLGLVRVGTLCHVPLPTP